jgi:hypothetical protein
VNLIKKYLLLVCILQIENFFIKNKIKKMSANNVETETAVPEKKFTPLFDEEKRTLRNIQSLFQSEDPVGLAKTESFVENTDVGFLFENKRSRRFIANYVTRFTGPDVRVLTADDRDFPEFVFKSAHHYKNLYIVQDRGGWEKGGVLVVTISTGKPELTVQLATDFDDRLYSYTSSMKEDYKSNHIVPVA